MVRSIFAALVIWAALGLGSTAFADSAFSNDTRSTRRSASSSASASNSASHAEENNQNMSNGYYMQPNYNYRGSGILDRPNRPGHPVGNTIRAFFGRG